MSKSRGNADELLVRCLENKGVQYDLGLPGEEIVDVLGVLSRSAQFWLVVTWPEQGAAFMAAMHDRVSNLSGRVLGDPQPQRAQPDHRHRRRHPGPGPAGGDRWAGRVGTGLQGIAPVSRCDGAAAPDHQVECPG